MSIHLAETEFSLPFPRAEQGPTRAWCPRLLTDAWDVCGAGWGRRVTRGAALPDHRVDSAVASRLEMISCCRAPNAGVLMDR